MARTGKVEETAAAVAEEPKAEETPVEATTEGAEEQPKEDGRKRAWTPEQRAAQAERMREVFAEGTEAREKLKGRKMTDEQKAHLSEAMKAHDATHEHPNKGKPMTEEAKANVKAGLDKHFADKK